VVALGDSITDGAGTPLNTDTRWTDFLAARLNALNPGDPRRRTVFNAGIGGNTLNAVGNPQVGDNGLTRLVRDVLSHSNVTEVIVFAGTNDIYVGSTSRQVIDALRRTARRLHDAGTRAIVATLIPRGRGVGWHDGLESERLAVNAWIRRQAVFDALIDLDRATRDPARPDEMLSAFDADGTHPNAAGCEAMANAIDLDLFTATTPGSSDPNPRRGGTYARQAMVTA
jgi:lysophospholipase L1-like esterase